MLNSTETLLERQVPGAGKLSEFPDGSRIYTAVEDETLTEIATAFGIDPQELMIINLDNYSDLSLDAPLCEGTLLELPKVSESAGSEAKQNSKNVEAGVLGWIPIYVYGSGEKADQRTDGLLFECDKKYTVACNGREMKLSEFCQYAGNKKNRPRECIIITETFETLVDYEARRAPALSEGLQNQDALANHGNIVTESKEEFFAREMKIVEVPEPGSVVKVGSIACQQRRIGLVKERKSDGWYRVVMLQDASQMSPSSAAETEVRAYHVQQMVIEKQKSDLELWAVDFLRAMQSLVESFEGDQRKSLQTIQDRVVSEVSSLREETSKRDTKPTALEHSLVYTLKPSEWQSVAATVQTISPKEKAPEKSFCDRVGIAIRAMNELSRVQTPLSCSLVEKSRLALGNSDTEDSKQGSVPGLESLAKEEDVNTARQKLDNLNERKKELESKLKAVSEKLAAEEATAQALALAQDQEAANAFCVRHHDLAATMAASHLDCKISRDLTILLRDLVAFQGASRLALRLLCVQKLLNALERDLSFLSERLRNESFFGRELGMLSTSHPAEMLDSSTLWKFCAAELQSSAEYRALTLKAAKRIQRHCSTVLSSLGPELSVPLSGSEAGHDGKGLSATFGSGSIRWHAESDGSFLGSVTPASVVRGLQSAQQTKPKVPELVEASTHSVVLRFLVHAEEYQVAWEKGCQHSRGTAWLNPLRATEALYTVTGLSPATEYRFRFRAFTAGAWGEWSKAVLYSTVSESAAKCDLLTFASTELKDVPVLRFWCARNRDDDMLAQNLGEKTTDTDLFQKSLSLAFRRLHSSTVSLIEKLEAAARSSEAHGHRNLALVSLSAKSQRLGASLAMAGGSSATPPSNKTSSGELALTPAQLLAASRPPQAATVGRTDASAPLAKTTSKKLLDPRAKTSGDLRNEQADLANGPNPYGLPGNMGMFYSKVKQVLPPETQQEIDRWLKQPRAGVSHLFAKRPSPPLCVKCKQIPSAGGTNLCFPCQVQAKNANQGCLPSSSSGTLGGAGASHAAPHAELGASAVKPLTNAQRKQLGAKLAARLNHSEPSSASRVAGDAMLIDPPPATIPVAGKKRSGQRLSEEDRPSKR